jgi:CheY-like chemotaxis protein
MTLKLFVADDSITIQKVVSLTFANEDVVVDSVANGDLALDKVRSLKPDIVLADIFMPGCSGYEICASIKEDPELCHTPVVLLVGMFEPYDESEASRVKCDGCLTKPFDTSELIKTVRSLVGARVSSQESTASAEVSQIHAPDVSAARKLGYASSEGLVSARVWESFLSSDRVLDLFEPEVLQAANSESRPEKQASELQATQPKDLELSEELLNTIVERVVRRMSADVIREVAWEIVPELSEIIIRSSLEERNKP